MISLQKTNSCLLENNTKVFGNHDQVISHQVITGEQSKKYCETLPAPFERHDSEFSGGGADRENKC